MEGNTDENCPQNISRGVIHSTDAQSFIPHTPQWYSNSVGNPGHVVRNIFETEGSELRQKIYDIAEQQHVSTSQFQGFGNSLNPYLYNTSDELTLDVGGTKYKTTISTLCKDENSMLAALIRNQPKGFPGTLFIDRDGKRFRDVLNFLRVGTVHLSDIPSLRELNDEAAFFGIRSLQVMHQYPNHCDALLVFSLIVSFLYRSV